MTSPLIALLAALALPPQAPGTCMMPTTCEGAKTMLADTFRGDRKAAERWARKCGISRLKILEGRLLCGL